MNSLERDFNQKEDEAKTRKGKKKGVKDEEVSNIVTLPNRDITLAELNNLLLVGTNRGRLGISRLTQALGGLGESVPQSGLMDHSIDAELAELVALELGFDPKRDKRPSRGVEQAESRMRRIGAETAGEETVPITADESAYAALPPRPPVVCIMGHVDHGKTTLMDALRRRAAEAGLASGAAQGVRKKKVSSKKGGKKAKGGSKETGGITDDMAGTEAGGITQTVTGEYLDWQTE